ncbi:MAG TPA: TauD/TfdA family dioxygenase [Candidatus Angelobacter sp.]
MNGKDSAPSSGFAIKKRVPISASSGNLVNVHAPNAGTTLPITIQPATRGVDVAGWAAMSRDQIKGILSRHGAILFRGFEIGSGTEFQRFIRSISGNPLPYVERSSPRTHIKDNIYTSTEYPSEQSIFLHCENSYQKTWPLNIFFYCDIQPEQGGETPIADMRRLLARIDPEVRAAFANKGVLYRRNFGTGLGLPWQTVFQTDDREKVEQYCKEAGIECIWHESGRLTTRYVRKAIHIHPVTGEDVWFNHAVFFHITTLDPETQEIIRKDLTDDELPNNTYYGDGTPIEPKVLEHLRNVYAEETVRFTWQKDDVLMLDNMLVAHGRSPYSGARKILVGMTEPYSG